MTRRGSCSSCVILVRLLPTRPCPQRRRASSSFPLDVDDDLAAGVSCSDVADGFGSFGEWVGAIDHRCDLSLLDELGQRVEALFCHVRDEPENPLSSEAPQQERADALAQRACDEDECPVGSERALKVTG